MIAAILFYFIYQKKVVYTIIHLYLSTCSCSSISSGNSNSGISSNEGNGGCGKDIKKLNNSFRV